MNGKGICPIMSCRYKGAGYVDCLKERCEWWDMVYGVCGLKKVKTIRGE